MRTSHSGARFAKEGGESDERLASIAAWRYAPYFNDAERAALALTEAVTRLSDRADPVPDEVWKEAARHYKERFISRLGKEGWRGSAHRVARGQPRGTLPRRRERVRG